MMKKIKEMFSRKRVTITFTKTVRVFPFHMINDIDIVEAVVDSTMYSVYEIKKIDLSNKINKIVITCPKTVNKYNAVDIFLRKIEEAGAIENIVIK